MPPDLDFTPLTHPTAPPPRTNPTAHAVARLAAANGWQYFTHAVAQDLPGVVFREPNGAPRLSQRAVNIVRIPGDPMIEVGDGFYTESKMGNLFTQPWGYAAIYLGAEVPSATVEATRNRARSALPSTPAGAVQDDSRPGLSVEAAPGAEHAVDALLTPEIVAGLTDPAYPLDVELGNGWLFFYAPRSLSTDDAASWEHLLRMVELFVARVRDVSARRAPTDATPVDTASSTATPAAPMQSRGARVNGARVRWYLFTVTVGMTLAIGLGLLLTGR